MNEDFTKLITNTQKQFGAYTMLLIYRYYNISIKADPIALLSTTVVVDNLESDIEEVADVLRADDYTFEIYPKRERYIFYIAKGLKLSHPEFEISEEEKESESNTLDSDLLDGIDIPDEYLNKENKPLRYLKCKMAIVDKDRYDAYNNAVNMQYDEIKQKMDILKVNSKKKCIKILVDYPIDAINEVNEKINKLYDEHIKACDKGKADKLKEIEEAYQKYLKESGEDVNEKEDIASKVSKQMSMSDE